MHSCPATRPRRLALLLLPVSMAFCLAVASPVHAGASSALDFEQAVAAGMAIAPLLEARAADVAAAREIAAQADRLPDPELIAGVDNLPVGTSPFEAGGSDMTMKKLGLMQAFPARAKREARRAVAESLVGQATARDVVERLQARERVAQAWLAVWTAERELAALRSLHAEAELAVRAARARLEGGTGAAVDVMAARAAALEVENRLSAAQADADAARAGLASWLGVEPGAIGALGSPPELASLRVPEARLLATLDRQRALIDARSREAVAEARVGEAIAEKRPDWSVMAAYGQRDDGRDDMLMVEVRVGLPLFAGRRQDRLIAARRAELRSAAAERREAERAQREAVLRALAEWRGLHEQVRLHETRILPLARDRASAALAAYRAGGALQPWLDARRDELESHLMHARHLRELARVWASLAYLLPAGDSV